MGTEGTIQKIALRLRSLFRRRQLDQELDEEIREHLEHLKNANIAKGMAPRQAQEAALRQFGGVQQSKENCRDARKMSWLQNFAQDVSFGARVLRKNPGFTAVAVLTLALGIGANTAIFSVVQGVLLAPLPYRQPDRLVAVFNKNLTLKKNINPSYPDFLDWQRTARSFDQMAALDWSDYDLTRPGTPEHLHGKHISSGFFSTLGAPLEFGREFSPQEDQRSGAPVALISNRLWRNRFSGTPEILGKSVTLDGVDYTIVGVVPEDFHFDSDADVYTPLGQGDALIFYDRTIHPIFCIARLKPNVTLTQSQAEMVSIEDNLTHLYPNADKGLATDVTPLKHMLVGDLGGTLLMLLGAAGLVLLIACANIASLLLARSTARAREFAIRCALGASRARIVSQLLTESILLSIFGGVIGLVIAKWGLKLVMAIVPANLPRIENISVNLFVLLFAFGASIAVGILFGLAPAVKSSNADLQISLKESGRGGTSSGRHRAQSSLVIVQVGMAVVLLMGAGLLFRTIRKLWGVNPGFDAHHVLTFRVGLSPALTKTPAGTRNAYKQLLERIRQIPGVQAADLTVLVPLSQQLNIGPFWIGPEQPAHVSEAPRALFYWTGTDYLKTMEIPLLRGRYFTEQDTVDSQPVILIDSILARAYFPDRDPVGQTMTIPHWGPVRVIGVVGHVKQWALDSRDTYTENQIYASLSQLRDEWASIFYQRLSIAVRTPLDAETLLPAIRAAVYGEDGDQTVYGVATMQELVFASMASQRLPMILLGAFAALALLLASVGIYGVLSYYVAQRVHEIGIRMALGAERRDVFRMIIGQGLSLTLSGVAIGALAGLVLERLLSSFSHLLYGVGIADPITFVTVSGLLVSVAALACWIPARRATRIDPMVALRYE
ncbi:MAG TPA: ABC transporter permease [Candidatus Acidoferrales bacterium]